MKIILAICFLFGSLLARADQTQNNCSLALFKIGDWSELTESALTCLNSSDGFVSGISALCEPNRCDLSVKYLQFLKYKKEYEETLAWFQSLSTRDQQSAVARFKLRLAKENWEGLGEKDEVRSIKNKMDESFHACLPNQSESSPF